MLLGFGPLTSSSRVPWKLVRNANFQNPSQIYWISLSEVGPSRKSDNFSNALVKRSSPFLKAANSLFVEFLCSNCLSPMTSWMACISLGLLVLSFLYWNNSELCFNSATTATSCIRLPYVYKTFIIPILKMPKTEAHLGASQTVHLGSTH